MCAASEAPQGKKKAVPKEEVKESTKNKRAGKKTVVESEDSDVDSDSVSVVGKKRKAKANAAANDIMS